MKVIDMDGNTVTVMDLDMAIKQAGEYRHYRHEDEQYRDYDRQRQAYWQHMYMELLKIKQSKSKQQ